MGVVEGAVAFLATQGVPSFAHRRWSDPEPGQAVVVITDAGSWTAGRGSAEYPALRVLVYAAPTEGQDDADQVVQLPAKAVRAALHRFAGGEHQWGDVRVVSSLHVGSSTADVEGHDDWVCRTLTFEVETV